MVKKRKYPNFIDIAFLILIIAVALAAYVVSHQNSDTVTPTVQRSIVIELTELEPEMTDAIVPGDTVTETIKNQLLGTVTAVEATPFYESVFDEEAGICRKAEVPGKITLMVTVQSDTIESDSQISAASGFVLRVGTGVSCTIGKLSGSGHIVGVER